MPTPEEPTVASPPGADDNPRWWPSTLIGLCLFGFAFLLSSWSNRPSSPTAFSLGGHAGLGAGGGAGGVSAATAAGAGAGSGALSHAVTAASVQPLPSGAIGSMVLALVIGITFLACYWRATRRMAALV